MPWRTDCVHRTTPPLWRWSCAMRRSATVSSAGCSWHFGSRATSPPGQRPTKPTRGVAPQSVEAQIHRLLVEQGLHLAAYLDPPAQTDRSSLSYCPRCEVEYAVLAGTCSDCTGVSLVAFAPTYARVSA
jgi:hypothetical protein